MASSKQLKVSKAEHKRLSDIGFQKGKSGNPGGVPKDLRKLYHSIKEEYGKVFYKLGGAEEFLKWIKEGAKNKEKFYEMLVKLMPKEILAEGFNAETKIIIVRSSEHEKSKKDSTNLSRV